MSPRMSPRGLIQAAIVAALRESAALVELTAVFDAPPVRFGLPHAVVDEPLMIDWSAKDWTGREGRVAVTLHDAGERPVRLRALIAEAEDAVLGLGIDLAANLGGGWRLAGVVLTRSRIARGAGERWVAMSEFRVRVYREI